RVTVTFSNGGGDRLLYPTTPVELHNVAILLETDQSGLRSNVDMSMWVAGFRGTTPESTLVYAKTDPPSATVRLWNDHWDVEQTVRSDGVAVLQTTPGPKHIGADHREGEDFGRLRGELNVASYGLSAASISSILIAPGALPSANRDRMVAAMPARLRFQSDSVFTLYAELYSLAVDAAGTVHYEVIYTFQREDGDPISFEFERELPVTGDRIIERLVVQPGQIPSGEYTIEITVFDRIGRQVTQVTRVDVEMD
ncbi:MAG: hypothetical protein ACE5FJ_12015, partial [Gemmatimonadales bacterium]